MVGNVAYAHALKTKAYLMTLDEKFEKFLVGEGTRRAS